ncbi:Acyl transferase domain-containing protein [Streptomyces zhaozhouensis]|uniref:Acyl transferase domain-containing protein n=2 Tax=Streptomyces zhaozhouensis TaxID=1300267 RepID=A0A286DZ37_9ACTN|nr:Acyl transferase domain-containing protein [Streptomyces zhaozhouensis]
MAKDPTRYQGLLSEALTAVRDVKRRLRERAGSEPVAVVGMACRFPGGCDSPEAFWRLLTAGGESVVDAPEGRWELAGGDGTEPARGNFLHGDVSRFDARFFRMSPAEANSLDPQQRLLLEVCWESLENAGMNPQALRGSRTGVFVGLSGASEYGMLPRDAAKINQYNGTGTSASAASGRLAYEFGWHGPALSVDTACSSSLVGTHLAVQALRRGECTMAVAGGVSLMLSPHVMTTLRLMNAVSPDGRSRPFDAGADGYGRGEGCGMLVLKRLSDAERDGDTVLAVIRGSAVNNDGPSSGLTVPSGRAQREVIGAALKSARVAPGDVGYVEAHGTGTPLGDPIEVEALSQVFGPGASGKARRTPLLVGSVKGNIGHLDSAAGVAGLIKTVLCLRHGVIPPLTNFDTLNPRIRLGDVPVELPRDNVPWRPGADGRRVAGVSSFGFSGTNAHVVLAEAPPAPAPAEPETPGTSVLFLSAKEESSLVALVRRYDAHLAEHPDVRLDQLCHVANTCRAAFMHRATFVADSVAGLREGLRSALDRAGEPGGLYGPDEEGLRLRAGFSRTPYQVLGGGTAYAAKTSDQITPKLAFVLHPEPGDVRGAARALAARHPAFRAAWSECLDRLAPRFGPSFADALASAPAGGAEDVEEAYWFAFQYAVAQLLAAFDVRPEIVAGGGPGRLVAAVVAGVLSLDSAVALLAAAWGARELPAAAREAALADALRDVPLTRPDCRLVSAATGREGRGTEIADAAFWARELAAPSAPAAVPTLLDQGYRHLLVLGGAPGADGTGDADEGVLRFPLGEGEGECARLAHHLAALTCLGAHVRWETWQEGRVFPRLPLPTYPFERTRYWITPPDRDAAPGFRDLAARAARGHGLDGERLDLPAGPTQYEYVYSARNFPELADNTGVLHMGYYVEMLTAALRDAEPRDRHRVERLEFLAPLRVVSGETKRVTLVLERADEGRLSVRFFSKSDLRDGWVLHVHGTVAPAPARPPASTGEGPAGGAHVDADAFYRPLEENGFRFGPTVRWVDSARAEGNGALVHFRAHTLDDGIRPYAVGFHPGVLDSCAQAFNFLALPAGEGRTYMIRSLGGITVGDPAAEPPAPGGLLAHVTLDDPAATAAAPDGGEISGAVQVRDSRGATLLTIEQAVLKEFDESLLADIQSALEAGAAGDRAGDPAFLLEYAETPDDDKPGLLLERTRALLAAAMEVEDPATLEADAKLDDLGLDSLIGLRFFNSVRDVFGVELGMADLIDAHTIRETAMLVLGGLPGSEELVARHAATREPRETPKTGRELWILGPAPRPEAKVRLFCFPHGFGSADMYKDWQEALGPSVHVAPVKLPGLDVERMSEELPRDIDALMAAMEESLSEELLDLPVMAFGHSWGSLFAYRLARRLSAHPKARVARLFVSGYTAPVLPNTSTMRIVEELRGLGFTGIPDFDEVTATKSEEAVSLAFIRAWDHESDFVEFALEGARLTLPGMLGAYQLVERFTHDPAESFDVPITGFHGLDDNRVSLEEMKAWERVTSGAFDLNTLAGDHGFIDTAQSEGRLTELLGTEIAEYIAGTSPAESGGERRRGLTA